MNESSIRILIAEDHTVVRKGLSMLLSTPRFHMAVVAEAADGEEAIEMARRYQPDVIIMDLEMPKKSGIEATAAIRQENPQARILVLTSFNETDRAVEAVRAGAMGFLLKDSSPDELVSAIRTLYRGQVVLPTELAQQLMQPISQAAADKSPDEELTERETAILAGLVQGLSNKEIADQLHISPNTVRTHVRNILTKLDVTNRTQAAMYAVEHDLLSAR